MAAAGGTIGTEEVAARAMATTFSRWRPLTRNQMHARLAPPFAALLHGGVHVSSIKQAPPLAPRVRAEPPSSDGASPGSNLSRTVQPSPPSIPAPEPRRSNVKRAGSGPGLTARMKPRNGPVAVAVSRPRSTVGTGANDSSRSSPSTGCSDATAAAAVAFAEARIVGCGIEKVSKGPANGAT